MKKLSTLIAVLFASASITVFAQATPATTPAKPTPAPAAAPLLRRSRCPGRSRRQGHRRVEGREEDEEGQEVDQEGQEGPGENRRGAHQGRRCTQSRRSPKAPRK